MKKNYQKPTMIVAEIQAAPMLVDSVNNVKGADLNYGAGGNGPARSRSNNSWDDEDID